LIFTARFPVRPRGTRPLRGRVGPAGRAEMRLGGGGGEWLDSGAFFRLPKAPRGLVRFSTAALLLVPLVACIGALLTEDRVAQLADAAKQAFESLDEFDGRALEGVTEAPTSLKLAYAGAPSITAFLTPFACMLIVMYQLRLLLIMAHIDMDEDVEYSLVRDSAFQDREKGQDWCWDFVLVTSVKSEDHATPNDFMKRHTMLKLVEALTNADLETCQYKSRKFDKILIKIRASSERLKDQADKCNKRMRLAEHEVKKRLQEGEAHPILPDEWIVYPRKESWMYRGREMHTAIFDTEEQCPYQYYEHMFGVYDDAPHLAALYHVYPRSNSIFRSVDRIKLIMSILKWPASDNGAGLALEQLLAKKAILHAFPLHDRTELRALQGRWLRYWAWPWQQPFTRIKDYFGEKVGLYFVFLGHYTTAVMIAAIVGFIFYLIVYTTADSNSPAIPVFCVFMSLWATLFIEFWKRKQNRYAMMWGQIGVESVEDERPEFAEDRQVQRINSPVDGEEMLYFPPHVYGQRVLASYTIILTLSTSVVGVVVAIFFLKAIMATMSNLLNARQDNGIGHRAGTGVKNWGINAYICDDGSTKCDKRDATLIVDFAMILPGVITSFANTIQIFAFENFFNELANRLNNYECHRTSTQFADNLTAKVFIFQFINSFTSYLYIAFFKRAQANTRSMQLMRGNYSCLGSCMDELQLQLGSIFITKVIVANTKDILIPYLTWTARRFQELRRRELAEQAAEADALVGDEEEEDDRGRDGEVVLQARLLSPAEEEMGLDGYEEDVVILGTFADYRDLVIIYGYTVLFVAAFPLAPMMALVNSYVQIRVDAWKLAQCSRRPWPQNAEDIGTWADIIELMSYLAVIINSLIITYTGTFLDSYPLADRAVVFILLYHVLIFVKYVTAVLVEDVPSDVMIQIARQAFVESKLIRSMQDDVIEVDGGTETPGNAQPDLTVYDRDDDVVYLDYPGYEMYAEEMRAGGHARKPTRALRRHSQLTEEQKNTR